MQILSLATCEHRWSGWQPVNGKSWASQAADLPRVLEDQVARHKEDLKRWQSTTDRYRIAAWGRRDDFEQPKEARSKKGGKGGKGNGGASSRGDDDRDRRQSQRDGVRRDNRQKRKGSVQDVRRRP